jgi:hypothetical protein
VKCVPVKCKPVENGNNGSNGKEWCKPDPCKPVYTKPVECKPPPCEQDAA